MWRATDGVEWALLVAAYHGHTETRLQSASIFLALAKRARGKAIRREHGIIKSTIDGLRTDVTRTDRCTRCGEKVNGKGAKSLDGLRLYCIDCQEDIIRMEPDVAPAMQSNG
jgi:hypothetical protein